MNIKLWDKRTSINGITADVILKNREDLANASEVLLFEDEYGKVVFIEIPQVLKSNLKLPVNISAIEVGRAYLNFIEAENAKASQQIASTDERLKTLETENAQMTYALMMGGLL